MENTMYKIIVFHENLQDKVIDFFYYCLPESGRKFDPKGRHKSLTEIKNTYDIFWCLKYNNEIIGTVAVNSLSKDKCELKSLYLLNKFQRKGLGQKLLNIAFEYATRNSYKEMYLDTLKSSTGAIGLYKKNGFIYTERYNDNMVAEVFMKKILD